MNCEKEHINHPKIYYGNILSSSDEVKKRINDLEKNINEINNNIDNMIRKLKIYKENINNYYQISVDIMKNVDNKNRNYEILNNIIEISNNDVMKDIERIVEEKDIKNKVNIILDITDKFDLIKDDEITLIYNINNKDNVIKLFDTEFVNNNKNICKIIYQNKEIELKDVYGGI